MCRGASYGRHALFASCTVGCLSSAQKVPRGYNDCHRRAGSPQTSYPERWRGDLATFFDDFRRLEDINTFVDELQARHPELVRVTSIGSSWEGRPLRMLEITQGGSVALDQAAAGGTAAGPPGGDRPAIVLAGGLHAREWIAVSTVLFIAKALVEGSSSKPVAEILQRYVFALIAPANPDGYAYTWDHDRMWRKNRSNRTLYSCRGEVAGVDLNRNWDWHWRQTEDSGYARSLRNPCTEVFTGPEPFSEPELAAISGYMAQRQKRSTSSTTRGGDGGPPRAGPGYIAAFLDVHSYAQRLLPPWAYIAEAVAGPDRAYQQQVTDAMLQAIKATSGRTFEAGADLFPADPGTGPDWAYGKLGVRATMTVELEPSGMPGFCLGREAIQDVGREQFAALLALVEQLVAHGDEPSASVGLLGGGLAGKAAPVLAPAVGVFAAVLLAVLAALAAVCWRWRGYAKVATAESMQMEVRRIGA